MRGDLAGFGCVGIDQPSRENYAIFLKNYEADLHKSFEKARTLLLSQNDKNKRFYDLRRRPNKFVVGDIVWRTNHILSNAIDNVAASLAPKRVGPFEILKITNGTCELADLAGKSAGLWHARDLVPYVSDSPG